MSLFGRPTERDDARAAGYRDWFHRQNPLAFVSLLFSVFSLTHFGTLIVDEGVGIALGAIALKQIARARERQRDQVSDSAAAQGAMSSRTEGQRLAWAGIGVGIISLLCAVTVYFFIKPA